MSSRSRPSLLVAGTAVASAANLGFLNDTPISYMKQRDLQALNKRGERGARNQAGRRVVDWNNKGAGNPVSINGTVTPQNLEEGGDAHAAR